MLARLTSSLLAALCAIAGTACGDKSRTAALDTGAPSLVIEVVDTSGAAMQGVSLEITGKTINQRLKTGADGRALANELPPGSYTVAVIEEASQERLKIPAERGNKYKTLIETVAVTADTTARIEFRVPSFGGLLVEVDTQGLKAPVDGAFFTLQRKVENVGWVNLASAPKARMLESAAGSVTYRFDAVPTGSYRVRLNPRDRVLSSCEAKVLREAVTTCRLGPCAEGLAQSFSYAGAVPEESSVGPYVLLQLSRWNHRDVDVAHTHFSESQRTTTVRGLRAGRYVALLRPANLARLVDIGESAETVTIEPPADGVASGGDRTLTVEVHADGKPLHRLLACLVPKGSEVKDGLWMRFVAALTVARFEKVPTGDYEVWVFDGTQGGLYSLAPNPLRKPVSLTEPKTHLVIDV